MKRILSVFFILVAGYSCVEKLIEKPEDLIAKEEMTDILFDIALLQAARSTNGSILENNGVEIMPMIYKKYGIDSTQFVQSDLYYASVPLVYQSIYENVESRIEQRRAKLEVERKRENDSIRNRTKNITDSLRQTNRVKTRQDTLP